MTGIVDGMGTLQDGSLIFSVAAPDTLAAAWDRVRTKAAGGGIDRVSIDAFGTRAEHYLQRLGTELEQGSYVPEPVMRVSVPKAPNNPERRELGLPTVRDKIAQTAVRIVIEPLLDVGFSNCSYGYRPGKGALKAIRRVNHYLCHQKRQWAACADVDNFFGSIDQARLLQRLQAVLKDPGIMRLIELWLRMGAVDRRGRWHDADTGVHQGLVLAPLLANFYLHPFDAHMTELNFGLVRYADDLLVLCMNEVEAQAALEETTRFLRDELRLRLNEAACPVSSLPNGFVFLGIRFEGTKRGIAPEKRQKIELRIAQLVEDGRNKGVRQCLDTLGVAADGWARYYGRLVDAEDLGQVECAYEAALETVLVRAFRSGELHTQEQAKDALRGLALVVSNGVAGRARLFTELVKRARAAAKAEDAADAAGSRQPSIEKQVRRTKRRHVQKVAQRAQLVVNMPGSFIGKKGQTLVVRCERRTVFQCPVIHLAGVTVAGHGVSLSSDAITLCAEQAIPIAILAPQGKVSALLVSPNAPNGAIALLQAQAIADPPRALELGKRICAGKVRNQINLIKYFRKYHKKRNKPFAEACQTGLDAMRRIRGELPRVILSDDPAAVRGRLMSIEGRAASHYWELISALFGDRMEFAGREHRGATDPVNMLLNYGYAVLQSRVMLAALRAGLNLNSSFLHAFQPNKPTLAFDLMEEFRPAVVDRTVVSLILRRHPIELDPTHRLSVETRRRLIDRLEHRFAALVHCRGKELTLEQAIQGQATRLVEHLQGGRGYRCFADTW